MDTKRRNEGASGTDSSEAISSSKLRNLLTIGTHGTAMPLYLRAQIFTSICLPIAAIALICGLLTNIDESSNTNFQTQVPHLYVNGTGSSMMANTYWRSLAMFSTYLTNQKASYIVDSKYISTSSGVGKSDFSNGYSLYAATDSDVSKADL
ncbi:hypothetical protein HDU99_010885, partial [Rhizoclosmatium hyalinum]